MPLAVPSPSTPFIVTLTRDEDAGVWVATCDEIPLATEADTLDGLVARVSAIAPDLAVLNGHVSTEDEVDLHLVLDVKQAARAS